MSSVLVYAGDYLNIKRHNIRLTIYCSIGFKVIISDDVLLLTSKLIEISTAYLLSILYNIIQLIKHGKLLFR